MENKRKALGRGLEQLFSNESLYVNPIDPIEEIVEKLDINWVDANGNAVDKFSY